MTTPDAERMFHDALQQGVELQNEAAKRASGELTQFRREMTEVQRLDAARRERIEKESIETIASTQAEMRPTSTTASNFRPVQLLEFETRTRQQRSAQPPADPNEQVSPAGGGQNAAQRVVDPARAFAPVQSNAPQSVEVKARRELTVKLEDDSSALVESLVQQVEVLLDQRDQLLLQQVEQRLVDMQSRRRNSLNFTT